MTREYPANQSTMNLNLCIHADDRLLCLLERLISLHEKNSGTKLDRILSQLSDLKQQGKTNMALQQETLDILGEIDTETTRIAERIEEILAEDDDPVIRARLQPHLNQLKGMAHNPEQPVPPAPPE